MNRKISDVHIISQWAVSTYTLWHKSEHYCLLVPLTQHRERPAMSAIFVLALCRLGGRMMPPPTDPTRHTAPMTCSEWWVTPEAGHQQ